MGTRSLTVIKDGKEEIVVIYRQFDGYPKGGHGEELSEILAPKGQPIPTVNGISDKGMCFNGGGCAAAWIVSKLKTDPGGIYLHPAGTRNCGEDYIYTVTFNEGKEPLVEVMSYDTVVFEGGARAFYDFCKKDEPEYE